jgi:hypothetical protein
LHVNIPGFKPLDSTIQPAACREQAGIESTYLVITSIIRPADIALIADEELLDVNLTRHERLSSGNKERSEQGVEACAT